MELEGGGVWDEVRVRARIWIECLLGLGAKVTYMIGL